MNITTLCTVVAALRVIPNKSQFFQYESVALSCEPRGNCSGWRIKRNTSTQINEDCSKDSDGQDKSYHFFDDLYPSDTGEYWCESAAGGHSKTITITVAGLSAVILESPALPVKEGDDVTLSCRSKNNSSNHSSDFYKGKLLIRSSSTGNITIHGVSRSDAGIYRCNISGIGQSPDSLLIVRGPSDGEPDRRGFLLVCIILPVVVASLLLICVMLLFLWRSHKGKSDSDVSYTDVIVTPQVQRVQRFSEIDTDSTFYSTLKLPST